MERKGTRRQHDARGEAKHAVFDALRDAAQNQRRKRAPRCGRKTGKPAEKSQANGPPGFARDDLDDAEREQPEDGEQGRGKPDRRPAVGQDVGAVQGEPIEGGGHHGRSFRSEVADIAADRRPFRLRNAQT